MLKPSIGYISILLILTIIPTIALAAGENDMDQDTPKVNIRFLYNYCNDLAEMRHFYTELLGMKETIYNEEWNCLCYRSEGFDFMFFGSKERIPVKDKFAWQPGWGGDLFITSWTIDIAEAEYAETIEKLKSANVPAVNKNPHWEQDSYWCFPVLDPMGNTVEVTTSPKEKPSNTDWPDK